MAHIIHWIHSKNTNNTHINHNEDDNIIGYIF
jgi:hypothetical protein